MSSLSKLIQLWNNNRFVPGGQTVSNSLPSDNETKRERFTKLHHDRTIVRDIRDGIAILGHAVDGLEKTQEFNRDPSAFKGNTREVLMSDDFLMVAHVLRLIFPEGMMSELRPRKRGRDEVDDDDNNNNHEEGGTRKYRPLLTPKGPSQLVPRTKQGPYTGGLFKSTRPEQPGGGLFKSTRPEQPGGGLFKITKPDQPGGGLFKSTKPEQPGGGLFKTGIALSFSDLKTDEQPGHQTSSASGSDPTLSSGVSFKSKTPISTGLSSFQPGFSSLGFGSSGIGSSDKPLSTGGLSSFQPGFSSLGFGSSGISSSDKLEEPKPERQDNYTGSLGSKETYEPAQFLTEPSFSGLKLTNEDKSPALARLGEPHAQISKRGHEEELEVAVKARKGGNQERFKLETPQDLISF
ncbi:uncharacterized protein FTOL_02111 [Fusarium torulosum]|uniref:Uncharacterized protein n=1 Tax=Fusarium torulosum TaxID=33205 RepID=A0AAE8M1W6_9HYPO|nr:uncharacterized protein FTOL_02111 [Fusarium torulosum]